MTVRDRMAEFQTLIDDEALAESDFQAFMERHPWLARRPTDHSPGNGVIRQFELETRRKPDFAYLWERSGRNTLVLVEIERPSKRIFTQADEFTAEFNQAVNQAQRWLDAHAEIINPAGPLAMAAHRRLNIANQPIGRSAILIFGRRSEINTPQRQADWSRRREELSARVDLYTFDSWCERFTAMLDTAEPQCQLYRYVQQDLQIVPLP
ncbi:Shedu immune nuclease family protein [Roseomonas sp. BN140053]|uniref:Shedu immune nuclease family protein n=1 Tax=Roseomonas sp. BN140053 TaxID=3391898 RepID=UPI0039E9BDD9